MFTGEFPLDGEDFHVRARSKLRVHPLQFVCQEALAHRSHDEGQPWKLAEALTRSWRRWHVLRFSSLEHRVEETGPEIAASSSTPTSAPT